VIAEARTKSTWEPALDSDVQAVLDNPSPFRSTRDIIEITSIYLETTGVAAIVANHRSGDPMQFGGPIVSLSVLRPSLIQIVPGEEYVKKFVYNVVGNLIEDDRARPAIPLQHRPPLGPRRGQHLGPDVVAQLRARGLAPRDLVLFVHARREQRVGIVELHDGRGLDPPGEHVAHPLF
jgi:hypothetical protein